MEEPIELALHRLSFGHSSTHPPTHLRHSPTHPPTHRHQVNLVSENAAGSLVLGTNSATLMGHLAPARRERTITFKMDQVGLV